MKSAFENGLNEKQKELLISFGRTTLIDKDNKHFIQLGIEPLDMLRYYIMNTYGWKTQDVFKLTEAQMYVVLLNEINIMSH
jgi:hypothetical protein